MLLQRLPDLAVAQLPEPLSNEQSSAARALISDGQRVSVLQALAGTGKTRVLAALARVYESAGYHVVGVAPTGRGARELADTAGIQASIVHRLVAELEESGAFAPRTVVLFDEAGSALTRPSAALFAHAERDGVKVIAVGDSGQLPSVAAGGWFAALTDALGGPQLREVMRQRDPAERDALAGVHDGDPDAYIELKCQQDELAVHEHEADALAAILADLDRAQQQHGLCLAVMITRDNGARRPKLNEQARQLLIRAGKLASEGVTIADQEFRVGDRVIARRNDRYRDIDNGALASITDIDPGPGRAHRNHRSRRGQAAGRQLRSRASRTRLRAHRSRRARRDRPMGRGDRPRLRIHPRTGLHLALRAPTRAYLIAEATQSQQDREQYAPPEPPRSVAETFEIMTHAIRRREAETLATQQLVDSTDMPHVDKSQVSLTPLTEIMESGDDLAASETSREFKHRRGSSSPRTKLAARPPTSARAPPRTRT